MEPTLGNGKICYLEIPTDDVERSAAFYEAVFGWQLRRRGDGALAFDDGVGQVSGTWRLGRPPSTGAGLLVYVMVDDVEATMAAVGAHGGTIVQPGGGRTGDHGAPHRPLRQPARPLPGAVPQLTGRRWRVTSPRPGTAPAAATSSSAWRSRPSRSA